MQFVRSNTRVCRHGTEDLVCPHPSVPPPEQEHYEEPDDPLDALSEQDDPGGVKTPPAKHYTMWDLAVATQSTHTENRMINE